MTRPAASPPAVVGIVRRASPKGSCRREPRAAVHLLSAAKAHARLEPASS
jgi:hypothetical protein